LIIKKSIPISMMSKGFMSAFRNGFAPVKIFNAIPSPSDCVRFPRRTTASGETLLGVPRGYAPLVAGRSEAVPPPKRVVMAKSSMVASTIPKSSSYHGNKDAYIIKKRIVKSTVGR